MFGDGRPQTGALILPSESGARLINEGGEGKYLEAIWPVIAEANAAAPSHSRILPEMVRILPVHTEIPVVRRSTPLIPTQPSDTSQYWWFEWGLVLRLCNVLTYPI